MGSWTIRAVVQWAAKDFAGRGITSARLDAELLVGEALSLDRVRLYMDLDRPLDEAERAAIRDLVRRRRRLEPVAYILGHREFYGRRFEVSPAVLIPRPDTETLVERALALLPGGRPARVLDLCTGSGAIGLTLAAERPELQITLTDVSAEALTVAKRNEAALGVQARLLQGDLFEPVDGRFSLITVNPPYVTTSELGELASDVREHEPELALVSGPTGFEVHRRLVGEAGAYLEGGGAILVEVGAGQAAELARLFEAQSWVQETRVHDDLSTIERVVEAKRAARPGLT